MTRNEALAQAEEALERGANEEALKALAPLALEDGERALLAAEAHICRNDGQAAERELMRAEQALGLEDEDVAWLWSELCLRRWQLDAARAHVERALAAYGEPLEARAARFLERLALCLDHAGDFAAADRALARAAALAPTQVPRPAHLSEEELDRIIDEGVAQLPESYRALLAHTPILIEPVPAAPTVAGDLDDPWQPDLLGLFEGETLHDLAEDQPARLPSRIWLFQRNLERMCHDRDELVAEIHTTLFHELGHFLGLDEDEVDALGLG